MAAVTEPVISEFEAKGGTWLRVKAHLERRLALMRAKNDASMGIEKTERLRGRIQEIKNLMALDKPTPPAEENDIE